MERTFPWSPVYLQSLSVRTLGVSTKKWANVAVGWVESYHCLPWHVHFAYVRVPPIPRSVDDLTPLPHHLLLPTLFSWPKRGYVEFTFGESFCCTWWPTDDFFSCNNDRWGSRRQTSEDVCVPPDEAEGEAHSLQPRTRQLGDNLKREQTVAHIYILRKFGLFFSSCTIDWLGAFSSCMRWNMQVLI